MPGKKVFSSLAEKDMTACYEYSFQICSFQPFSFHLQTYSSQSFTVCSSVYQELHEGMSIGGNKVVAFA